MKRFILSTLYLACIVLTALLILQASANAQCGPLIVDYRVCEDTFEPSPIHTQDRGTAELQYIDYLSGRGSAPYGWYCEIITPFEFGPDGTFYGGVQCTPEPWYVREVYARRHPIRRKAR